MFDENSPLPSPSTSVTSTDAGFSTPLGLFFRSLAAVPAAFPADASPGFVLPPNLPPGPSSPPLGGGAAGAPPVRLRNLSISANSMSPDLSASNKSKAWSTTSAGKSGPITLKKSRNSFLETLPSAPTSMSRNRSSTRLLAFFRPSRSWSATDLVGSYTRNAFGGSLGNGSLASFGNTGADNCRARRASSCVSSSIRICAASSSS
mmetsp:Transcript_11001/g.28176  ORF Transcript_11001/g.28176 Transcript_11001/m.28176 type:complete len:205 (-) Transcript_11001:970-1584(-)